MIPLSSFLLGKEYQLRKKKKKKEAEIINRKKKKKSTKNPNEKEGLPVKRSRGNKNPPRKLSMKGSLSQSNHFPSKLSVVKNRNPLMGFPISAKKRKPISEKHPILPRNHQLSTKGLDSVFFFFFRVEISYNSGVWTGGGKMEFWDWNLRLWSGNSSRISWNLRFGEPENARLLSSSSLTVKHSAFCCFAFPLVNANEKEVSNKKIYKIKIKKKSRFIGLKVIADVYENSMCDLQNWHLIQQLIFLGFFFIPKIACVICKTKRISSIFGQMVNSLLIIIDLDPNFRTKLLYVSPREFEYRSMMITFIYQKYIYKFLRPHFLNYIYIWESTCL